MGKKKTRKTKRGSVPAPAAPARATSAPPPSPAAPASRGRLWAFRLATAVAAPVVFLLLLELVLRVAGVGYSPSFFLEEPGAVRTNPRFGWTWFPPPVARVPVSARIRDPKPEGEIRIFVLGGSAAQGYPEPAFGFPRVLEATLRERYPGTRFEVVNAAVTAINSHVVLPVARDCARRGADLFVVYAGNNEIVGPFGPGTSFAGFSPSLRLIRASVALKRTRTGQLIAGALGGGGTSAGGWRGMEMFLDKQVRASDPRLDGVYDHLRRNLDDVIGVAREHGIGVVISTVASNLADCPPFASLHREDLSERDRAVWDEIYAVADRLEREGRVDEALARYRDAEEIDGDYAELHYRMGRCLLALGDANEARNELRRARELDALRFRADDGINRAIVSAVHDADGSDVRLADALAAFDDDPLAGPAGPGGALFVDHVHLSFEGNVALAAVVAAEIDALLPEEIRAAAAARVPTARDCARRLGFTGWERASGLQTVLGLTDRPPFTAQLGHERRRRERERRLHESMGRIGPDELRAFAETHREAVELAPDDVWLKLGDAEIRARLGQTDAAEREVAAALEIDPTHREALWRMAKLLGDAGRVDDEAGYLDRVIALDPYFINARTARAVNLVRRGRAGDAEAELRSLLRDVPGVAEVHLGLARVLLQERETDEALAELRQALDLRPGFADALSDLVEILVSTGRAGEALDACRRAVEREPGEARPHLLLAGLLEREGRVDEAGQSYAAAAEAEPDSVEARRAYGMFLERTRGPGAAVAYHRDVLRQDPGLPGAHYLLSFALMRVGRTTEAVAELREELRDAPNFRLAVAALARILATDPDPAIRDGEEATRWAERLVVLAPDDPTAFDTLAAAYAAAGRFDEAVTAEGRAIELARSQPGSGSDQAERYRRRMEAYRSGRALRSAPPASKK